MNYSLVDLIKWPRPATQESLFVFVQEVTKFCEVFPGLRDMLSPLRTEALASRKISWNAELERRFVIIKENLEAIATSDDRVGLPIVAMPPVVTSPFFRLNFRTHTCIFGKMFTTNVDDDYLCNAIDASHQNFLATNGVVMEKNRGFISIRWKAELMLALGSCVVRILINGEYHNRKFWIIQNLPFDVIMMVKGFKSFQINLDQRGLSTNVVLK